MEVNNAALGYTKVALLFFIAMMVTWIPSSANRVYSVAHPGQISMGLELASAFVLPLQGFWNAVIYTTTSLPACKQVWAEITGAAGLRHIAGGGAQRLNRGNNKAYGDTESMTELASRPSTQDSPC